MAFRSLDDLLNKKKGGRWKMSDRHEIQYSADGEKSTTVLKATILDVQPAALLIQYTQKEEEGNPVSGVHELQGTWRVDPKNRINFIVERETGKSDVLTFRNVWTVNENHEIEYSYEETALKKREKILRKLIFKGFWDISEKSRITYWLSKDSNSALRFRGAFQTKSILAKKEEIRYQIGVEAAGKRTTRTFTLFGKWKYSHKYGLSFEVDYKDGRKNAIRFGAEYSLSPTDHIELGLISSRGESLGAELVLTKDFLKGDGQAFVRFLKNAEESKIEAGATWRW